MSDPASGDPVSAPQNARLIALRLDPASIGRNTPDVEHERDVAIFDLLESNSFAVDGHASGPYGLLLGMQEDRLTFTINDQAGVHLATFMMSLTPFRRIVKDYFMVCESYFEAIRTAPPSRIEAIDMGRRGMHDEGSQLLMERLKGKVKVDFPTARRLFTLICALQWKG
jgi:uncharacterized protein (UPF0262 family)